MESEHKSRTTSDRAPDLLWMANRGGVLTHCLGPGLESLAAEPQEWIGRAVSEVFPDTPEVAMHLRRVLEGEAFTILLTLKGTTFKLHYYPAQDRKGEIAGAVAVGYDVTRRAPGIDEPMRLHAVLERAFGGLTDAALVWDPDTGSLAYCNPAAERLFGYTGQELREVAWRTLLLDEERGRDFHEAVAAALERDGTYEGDWAMLRKDDRRVWCAWRISRILDEDGHPLAAGLARDVTEPRAVEEELEMAEERFEAVFERAPFALLLCRDGEILQANPAAEGLFGRQGNGEPWPRLDAILESNGGAPTADESLESGSDAGSRAELVARRADGTTLPVAAEAREIELPDGPATLVTVDDVEAEREELAGLEDRVRQLETLTGAGSDLIGIVDEAGTYLRLSPSCERVLGFRADQLVGTHLLGNVHPDDEEAATDAFREFVDDPSETGRARYRLRHRNGDWLCFDVSFLTGDAGSPPAEFVVRHRDVTVRNEALQDRERLEEELRRARSLLERLRELARDADEALVDGTG